MTGDQDLRDLLTRYRAGQASDEEIALLESRYVQWAVDPEQKLSEDILEESKPLMWAEISARTGITKPARYRKLWRRVSVAAAIAATIFTAGLLYLNQPDKSNQSDVVYTNDIAPARQGATLTLSNGKKILLSAASTGELFQQSGITVKKTATGQLVYQVSSSAAADEDPGQTNTLSTAKGETYQLRLPDGSLVWLNAASSLTYYPSLIQDRVRRVKLIGEGYFEIAKDKEHPFIVESYNQKVEVLGTHFNINSYGDEKVTKTTLFEGSLRVSPLSGSNKGALLKPGEASVMLTGAYPVKEPGEVRNALAWKNGFFRFDQLTIDQVMNQLARWYDIEIVYQGGMPDERFSGAIARNKNISEVLRMLSYSKAVKFKIEGRRVAVMR